MGTDFETLGLAEKEEPDAERLPELLRERRQNLRAVAAFAVPIAGIIASSAAFSLGADGQLSSANAPLPASTSELVEQAERAPTSANDLRDGVGAGTGGQDATPASGKAVGQSQGHGPETPGQGNGNGNSGGNGGPDKPEKPENPAKPEDPGNPDKPDTPGKPDKPENTEKPDTDNTENNGNGGNDKDK